MNPICDIKGCQYNESGRCIYAESSIKIPEVKACEIRYQLNYTTEE